MISLVENIQPGFFFVNLVQGGVCESSNGKCEKAKGKGGMRKTGFRIEDLGFSR